MPVPEVRAALVQNNAVALDRVEEISHEQARRVRVRWGRDAVDAVTIASRIGWLPVEYDVRLAIAIDEEVGPTGLRAWARSGLSTTLESPMLRTLVDGAVRIFESSPGAAYRWVCRGWTILFRNCGVLDLVSFDTRSCNLVLHKPPHVMLARPYLEGMASSLAVPLELFGVVGNVDLDAKHSEVRFSVSWRRQDVSMFR